MSDNTPIIAIGIVAIITALGTASAMLCKVIKRSDCMGVHIESRTPPPTFSLPPSPIMIKKEIITNETVV
jgi:hypothetical protein